MIKKNEIEIHINDDLDSSSSDESDNESENKTWKTWKISGKFREPQGNMDFWKKIRENSGKFFMKNFSFKTL